jgi:hypothetical protein
MDRFHSGYIWRASVQRRGGRQKSWQKLKGEDSRVAKRVGLFRDKYCLLMMKTAFRFINLQSFLIAFGLTATRFTIHSTRSMDLPRTPLRHSDQAIPVSPVVLEIERRLLFTPTPASFASTPVDQSSPTACTKATYSPRPDDFYFEDGAGGYVTKLELPDDEKNYVLDADDFLSDIRRLEEAIEVSRACTAI